jgi:hypothetical protein
MDSFSIYTMTTSDILLVAFVVAVVGWLIMIGDDAHYV